MKIKSIILGIIIICIVPITAAASNSSQYADGTITNMTDLSNVIATHAENRDTSYTIHYVGDTAELRNNFESMYSDLIHRNAEVNLFVNNSKYDMKYTSTYADITMKVTYSYTKEQEQYVDTQVNSILSQIITPSMSYFEREEAINNWLCNNVKYDKTLKRNTAYDALTDGSTVCAGYAMLAHTLLTASGIQSQYITGTLQGTNHVWLMVCIDGNWYQYDPTNDTKESGIYRFFNQTDAFLNLQKFVWDTASYPTATTVYNQAEKTKDKERPAGNIITLSVAQVSSRAKNTQADNTITANTTIANTTVNSAPANNTTSTDQTATNNTSPDIASTNTTSTNTTSTNTTINKTTNSKKISSLTILEIAVIILLIVGIYSLI